MRRALVIALVVALCVADAVGAVYLWVAWQQRHGPKAAPVGTAPQAGR